MYTAQRGKPYEDSFLRLENPATLARLSHLQIRKYRDVNKSFQVLQWLFQMLTNAYDT
jgi:hypothetical protein